MSFRYVQNLFSCLKDLLNSKVTVSQLYKHGFLANLILLLYVLFSRSSFQPFLAHRSDFFVYDNVPSTLLRLSLFLISPLFRTKVFHIFNSKKIESRLSTKLFIGPNKRFIPNGYTDYCSDPGSITSNVACPSMPLKLLYVARYSPEKRHRYLFKVLSQLSIPFELTLIGRCTYNNKLFRKALEHHKITTMF